MVSAGSENERTAGPAETSKAEGHLPSRPLSALDEVLGPEHLKLAEELDTQADAYLTQGRFAECEVLYWIVLAIRERALGQTNEFVALSWMNLGNLYESKEEHRQAEVFFRRAVAISSRTVGDDHPDSVLAMQSLADNCWARGKLQEAEQLYSRTLPFWEKTLGPDHPVLATRLEKQAKLLRSLNQSNKALLLEIRCQLIKSKEND